MAINPATGLEEEIDPVTGLPKKQSVLPADYNQLAQAEATDQSNATPDVREYIMQKYGLGDKYNEAARQKIVDENKADASGPNWMAGLAALGAGIAGRDAMSAGQQVLNNQEAARKSKLDEFDKGRSQMIADRNEKSLMDAKDPTSERSKAAQRIMIEDFGMDPALAEKMSAEQIEARIPTLKSKVERDMREREFDERQKDRQLQRESMKSQRDMVREEKAEQRARPSDKQIEAFTDLDNAESDLNNILAQLGDKSNWTGQIDGRVPDFMIGDDQAAWRSAVGKYKDAYRKAITGAGASATEIATLEKRLPSETDSFENFKAKAIEAIKDLQRKRENLAKNLTAGGKNVSQFQGSSPKAPSKIRVSNGKEVLEIDPEDLADAEKDGYKRV